MHPLVGATALKGHRHFIKKGIMFRLHFHALTQTKPKPGTSSVKSKAADEAERRREQEHVVMGAGVSSKVAGTGIKAEEPRRPDWLRNCFIKLDLLRQTVSRRKLT